MIKIKRVLIIFIGFLTTLIFFASIISVPFNKKIYPNIYIAGIYLGDKSEENALLLLEDKVKLPEYVFLNINGAKHQILTSGIDTSFDLKNSVNRAYNYTNSNNLLTNLGLRFKLIFKPVNLNLKVNVNKDKLTEFLLIISSKSGIKPINPSAKIINNKVIVDSGKNGIEINIEEISTKILSNLSSQINQEIVITPVEVKTSLNLQELEAYRLKAEKFLTKNIELIFEDQIINLSDNDLIQFIDPQGLYVKEKIKLQINKIAKTVNRNPQDSIFIVANNTVTEFTPSTDGVTINEDKLIDDIIEALIKLESISYEKITINLPIITYPAKIKNEDVNNLGIKTLLGRGNSTFLGSIPNRIYNVNLAQSKFKGILIPTGETVSFNNILGDVSGLTGYKAAYVIKDGRTVLGDGGGVCQVSTTLFRALLDTGLPIIERRAHAYRVGYYEQGFPPGIDATVYSPTTDLKFKNDTPAYILIQPTIDLENLKLKFEIYGTSDGRVATISKPVITSQIAPPADLYNDDPTLAKGIIKQIEHRAWGAKVSFDYKVTKNGEVLIDQKFISNYRPWGAVFLRGTGI